MINLYFDKPNVNSLLADDIEVVAINWEISHEAALIKCFEVLVNSLGSHNSGGSTYFDLLMCDCFQKTIYLCWFLRGIGLYMNQPAAGCQ